MGEPAPEPGAGLIPVRFVAEVVESRSSKVKRPFHPRYGMADGRNGSVSNDDQYQVSSERRAARRLCWRARYARPDRLVAA